jgi:hypothetical protein
MKISKYRWGFVPPLSIKGSIPNLIIILQIYIIIIEEMIVRKKLEWDMLLFSKCTSLHEPKGSIYTAKVINKIRILLTSVPEHLLAFAIK